MKQFDQDPIPNGVAKLVPAWIDAEMTYARQKHFTMNAIPRATTIYDGGLNVGGPAYLDFFNYYGRAVHALKEPIEGNLRATQAAGKFACVGIVMLSRIYQPFVAGETYVDGYELEKGVKVMLPNLLPKFDEIPLGENFSDTLESRLAEIATAAEDMHHRGIDLLATALLKAQLISLVGHVSRAGVWAAPGYPSGELHPWESANDIALIPS